jgi:hypothetical protein
LPGSRESRQLADFRHNRHRRDPRDPAQRVNDHAHSGWGRLHGVIDRVIQSLEPAGHMLDLVEVGLIAQPAPAWPARAS